MPKKREKTLEVHVGYRIPAELQRRLLGYAVRNHLTASGAVRRLLEDALKPGHRG